MSADVPPNITKTRLLGGRVTCYQPKRGYRTAVDAVLLAACLAIAVDGYDRSIARKPPAR